MGATIAVTALNDSAMDQFGVGFDELPIQEGELVHSLCWRDFVVFVVSSSSSSSSCLTSTC
jgi:hypothetical protein